MIARLMMSLWFASALFGQQTPESASPEALQHMQTGVALEKRGDLDSAIKEFAEATSLAPNYDRGFLNLADAYMKKGDYGKAIAPLTKAAELNPDSSTTQRLLGFTLLSQGYAADAIPHLQRVQEYGALGIAQIETSRYSEAVASLQAALAKTPNDPDLLYYLAHASQELSSQSMDSLLTAFPGSARAHQAMAQHYFSTKETAKAEQQYEDAIRMRPDLPGLRLELGQVYASVSDWSKAEEFFRQESQLQPGNAEALFRLGDALMKQGKMKEAVSELQRSNQLHPDMPETLYDLGKSALNLQPGEAEQSLLRVTALEKETLLAAQAYQALSVLHRKQGKTELASKELQEFQRIQSLLEQERTERLQKPR
jgi:tetratricopeptide (TPR) repeat protein